MKPPTAVVGAPVPTQIIVLNQARAKAGPAARFNGLQRQISTTLSDPEARGAQCPHFLQGGIWFKPMIRRRDAARPRRPRDHGKAPMSCWVVPTVAAEYWGVTLDVVWDRIHSDLVPHKTEQ